jgi:selenocysteine lyase/cysteine desulfurase
VDTRAWVDYRPKGIRMSEWPAGRIADCFPAHARKTHFNSCGVNLCPEPVSREVQAFAGDLCRDMGGAFKKYNPCQERLRRNLAGMMGADPLEVAITHHTAEGTGIIANGIRWREGDTILTLDREYPSTVYPWMRLERTRGVRLEMLHEKDGRVEEPEIVAAIRRTRPRLFAISAVEWTSGYRFDLETLGKACEETGTFFFVDSAQALGITEVDVPRCRICAMAGSAWKWLFGPLGMGYLYLRADLLEQIQPVFVGSESVEHSEAYLPYHFTLRPDAPRFEYSTTSLVGVVWFDAGVRFVLDLGVKNIRGHAFALQDYAVERLHALGCAIRGGYPPEHRSGIMAFLHPRVESEDLCARLSQAGFSTRPRDGFVRLSFHVFNTTADIDRLRGFLENL